MMDICEICGKPGGEERMGTVVHFACKLKGISLGYTYGRESFHGPTIREQERQIHAEAAEQGRKITPVGNRWV